MKKFNFVIAVLLFALISCNKDLLQKEKKNLTEVELRLYDLDYIYNSNPYIIDKNSVDNRENKDEIILRIIGEMILKDKEFNYLEIVYDN
ncbi:hypothetical protein [Portibacter lacus]|uniref:Uncharacterized protein n=1 Tax=Portibacter lacus TaxID=1099794 RepID=A0AA37ST71_9BACT|nr:hypothetical protein [Portibacter lacus]GLR19747.1 hypothetical protein GCM10007940_43630 [Portibacter lacus]